MSYDLDGRLTGETSTADHESYAYDADGNRITQTINGATTNLAYATGSNQLTATSGGAGLASSYGYDANGNTTALNGATAYTYGPFNRLVSANGASFVISAEGQRLGKTFAGNATYFAPDTSGTLLAENDNGTWHDNVWLNGRLVDVIAGGKVYSVASDQTGRPIALTDPNTAIVWQANGLPFDRTVTNNTFGDLNLGFPGQYRDAEDGLYQNGNRDYDPATGRYIQSDPIGLAGGVNTYAYVGNNPIFGIDPLGLKCSLLDQLLGKVQNSLLKGESDVFNFLNGHVGDTLSVSGGDGLGATGSVTVTTSSDGLVLTGYGGIGVGLGEGVEGTSQYKAGDAPGFAVTLSAGGGLWGAGKGDLSCSIHGCEGAGGLGSGEGAHASLTVGYRGEIMTIPMPSINSSTKSTSSCGCGE